MQPPSHCLIINSQICFAILKLNYNNGLYNCGPYEVYYKCVYVCVTILCQFYKRILQLGYKTPKSKIHIATVDSYTTYTKDYHYRTNV